MFDRVARCPIHRPSFYRSKVSLTLGSFHFPPRCGLDGRTSAGSTATISVGSSSARSRSPSLQETLSRPDDCSPLSTGAEDLENRNGDPARGSMAPVRAGTVRHYGHRGGNGDSGVRSPDHESTFRTPAEQLLAECEADESAAPASVYLSNSPNLHARARLRHCAYRLVRALGPGYAVPAPGSPSCPSPRSGASCQGPGRCRLGHAASVRRRPQPASPPSGR